MKVLKHWQNILTRGLPKTGQTICYGAPTGDDGDYEAGWWVGRLNANNRQRWITKTIGGDDVVLDRATGLMWAADGNAAGCNNGATLAWTPAIQLCNALNFAGFTDWRLPNIRELLSIINYELVAPSIEEPPFANTKFDPDGYWSSTTYIGVTTSAWYVNFSSGVCLAVGKTDNKYLRAVRGGI